jgi:hypothetical protein
MEADLLAHCGERSEGAYLNTLVLTDIATGWTECVALLRRSEADVSGAIHAARRCLPFPLLGLDTDNGGEFINYELLRCCEKEKITFTRSRAYRKNDQAHVEEKNGSVVRRLIGYDRYEGSDAWRALSALYRVLRLYVNFFQPSMKLLSRERLGGHTMKHYDKARTPYKRVLESSLIGDENKNRLRLLYEQQDPVLLLQEVERLQDDFWRYAHGKRAVACPLNAYESVSLEPELPRPTLALSLKAATTADARQDAPRMYRRTRKPMGPRTWRTRIDPFSEVWGQIQLQVDIDPSRAATELFAELQHRYPGRFLHGQLRTLQRRVKQRRREQLYLSQSIQGAWPSMPPQLQA